MMASTARERRRHPRYALAFELQGKELSSVGVPEERQQFLHGRTQNISAGGLCLRAERPLKKSGLLRCELRLPGIPVAIPTLMRVRWIEQSSRKPRYRMGLEFLL